VTSFVARTLESPHTDNIFALDVEKNVEKAVDMITHEADL